MVCDDPACLAAAALYGARRGALVRRRRCAEVRAAQTERHCPRCKKTKPLDEEHWYVDKRDPETREVLKYGRWCKDCKREYQRLKPLTEEEAKRQAARKRRRRAALLKDPEAAAAYRAERAAAAVRARRTHPDRIKENRRRYKEKLKADPERQARDRERRRIERKLRRERQGLPLNSGRRERRLPERDGDRLYEWLPGPPLAATIDAIVIREGAGNPYLVGTDTWVGGRIEIVAERAGLKGGGRAVRNWREGERVQMKTADKVLSRLNLLWWEVWALPPEPPDCGRPADVLAYVDAVEAYVKAADLLGGERLADAA